MITTSSWLPYFVKEIEKLSFPLLGTAMNAAMVAGTAGEIGASKMANKLQPLKSMEQSFQLPGSAAGQVTNPTANSAAQLY